MEKVADATYAMSEYGHWEQVHSYLLLGRQSACLIDSGLGIGDIKAAVDTLTDLPVLALTTHAHWDHIGGHGLFDRVYVHEDDADWLRRGLPVPLAQIRRNLQSVTRPFPSGFKVEAYRPFRGEPAGLMHDGDAFELGDRRLRVMHTPGHSPGHACFYEDATGFLFTGDLVYAGALHAFYPSTDPAAFASSVARIGHLDARRVFPGHFDLGIGPDLIHRIAGAFTALADRDLLRHGAGEFDFGRFSIKL